MRILIASEVTNYADLVHEPRQEWLQYSVTVISIIIDSIEIVPKALPHKHKTMVFILSPIQKSVIVSTCNLVSKFLNLPCPDGDLKPHSPKRVLLV